MIVFKANYECTLRCKNKNLQNKNIIYNSSSLSTMALLWPALLCKYDCPPRRLSDTKYR